MRADVFAILKLAESPGDAIARIDEWRRSRGTLPALGALVFRTMAQTDLGGQMFVRDVEASPAIVKLDELTPTPTFLNLPFNEAIEFAKARGLLDDEGLADLLRTYRARGEEVSESLLRALQDRTAGLITRFVERGGTLDGFVDSLEAAGDELGIGPRDHAYLENVFRTGVQSSYGAGRYRGMSDDVVIDALPIRIYRTVGDDRVRPEHAAIEGFKWDAREDDGWSNYAPPNGYQCRCSMVTGFADEATRAELERDIPDEAHIDEDFFGPPTRAVDEPL